MNGIILLVLSIIFLTIIVISFVALALEDCQAEQDAKMNQIINETIIPYLKEEQEEYFKLEKELIESNHQAWQAVQDMVSAARDATMKK